MWTPPNTNFTSKVLFSTALLLNNSSRQSKNKIYKIRPTINRPNLFLAQPIFRVVKTYNTKILTLLTNQNRILIMLKTKVSTNIKHIKLTKFIMKI